MFSRSHFLSNRKQSTMSRRAQKRGTEEGPAVARPRSVCLVSRNLLSAKRTSSCRFGCFTRLGESRVGSAFCFRKKKDTCAEAGSRNQQRILKRGKKMIRVWGAQGHLCRVVCVSVRGVTWKPVRGAENQLAWTRLEYHNMQISDCRYVNKVFENLRQKSSLRSDVLGVKTNVLIC